MKAISSYNVKILDGESRNKCRLVILSCLALILIRIKELPSPCVTVTSGSGKDES